MRETGFLKNRNGKINNQKRSIEPTLKQEPGGLLGNHRDNALQIQRPKRGRSRGYRLDDLRDRS